MKPHACFIKLRPQAASHKESERDRLPVLLGLKWVVCTSCLVCCACRLVFVAWCVLCRVSCVVSRCVSCVVRRVLCVVCVVCLVSSVVCCVLYVSLGVCRMVLRVSCVVCCVVCHSLCLACLAMRGVSGPICCVWRFWSPKRSCAEPPGGPRVHTVDCISWLSDYQKLMWPNG